MLAFSPSGSLKLKVGAGGALSLPLKLQTDIQDAVYLSTVAACFERVWNESPAMRAARLSLRVAWEPVAVARLYPPDAAPRPGRPAQGAPIDPPAHLARFPRGFVLTTGGASLHVLEARAIVLGGAPIPCRMLAHEAAHLLGFADRYLRGYEGSPRDERGVVFYEVKPFPGDLLSDTLRGQVSDAMVRDLLRYR